jgi:SAM-dependent methyltransferase
MSVCEEGVERARQTYAVGEHRVAREVELRTLGSDFGANGYATLDEVDELVGILDLGPGRRLLDVGAGQGWPGLYLAREVGCAVVLTDMPFEGLAVAARRASGERIEARAWCLVARGQTLPLRPESFDAVVHTDVLCCLRPKLATLRASHRALRASHRALRPGGRTAFSVIYPTPELTATQAMRAIEAGPPDCGLRTAIRACCARPGSSTSRSTTSRPPTWPPPGASSARRSGWPTAWSRCSGPRSSPRPRRGAGGRSAPSPTGSCGGHVSWLGAPVAEATASAGGFR